MALGVGQETTATVHVGAVCSPVFYPLHIELVLDASANVAARDFEDEIRGVEQIIRDLKLTPTSTAFVGLLGFNDATRIACPVSRDEDRVLACLKRVESLHRRPHDPGPWRLDRAITEGLAQLRRARAGAASGEIREVLIVFSPGPGADGCGDCIRSSSRVKSEKVLVMSVCVGQDCDAACMRPLASSARYFFLLEDAGAIVQAFQRILEDVFTIRLRQLDLRYRPASVMRYVPDSAEPAVEATIAPDGLLAWRFRYVPRDGVTVTLRLAPFRRGRQPLAAEAAGDWLGLDSRNPPAPFTVPTVEVDVWSPAPLPPPLRGTDR